MESTQSKTLKTATELLDFLCEHTPNFPDKDMLVGYLCAVNASGDWLYGRKQHPDKWERQQIKDLYNAGFSMGGIALVVDRSKATIHKVLKETET